MLILSGNINNLYMINYINNELEDTKLTYTCNIFLFVFCDFSVEDSGCAVVTDDGHGGD